MIDSGSSDEQIVEFLHFVKRSAAVDAAVAARLARVLAESGSTYSPQAAFTADVASTGGPTSLTTLLCPLFLRCAGASIPKLGVPGRPAGGIDCLAQIPGYRTGFADVELDQVLERAGYAHFLADGRYAPLDARVFKLRQQHGLQEVPTLVAASLLSKKLAVGVRNAGLDIRVAPHGNFGRNSQEGERNAQLYRETAELLSIEAFPVLTDGTLPYQRYVGRSEALLALFRLFRGDVDTWLDEHYELCRGLACKAVPDEWKPAVRAAVRDDLRKAFEANVNAQGGSFAGFVGVAEQCSMGHRHELRAPANGVATYALEAIRKTLVELQSSVKASDACTFPDPVGLILQARPGSPVTAGSIVATARVDFPLKATEVVPRLMSALLQA